MEKMLLLYIGLLACPILIGDAAGHGLGGDVAPPIDFAGLNVTVSTKLNPSDITVGDGDSANMSIRFFDLDKDENLEKVTYRVEIWRSENLLARNLYYDLDGNLDIDIRTTYNCNEPKLIHCTQYYGAEHPTAPGALYARTGEKLVVKGPLFDKGGLYNIRVDIEGATSPRTLIADVLSYDTFVSVAQEQPFQIQTATAELDIKIKTYYDEVDNFGYDESSNAISFSMPFDWSPEYVEQVALVHEEIQIPKTFAPYADDKQLKGYVDGVEVDQRVLVMDPYSYDDKNIIHFLVTGNELKRINNILGSEHKQQTVMNFKIHPDVKVLKNHAEFYLVNQDTLDKSGATVIISWDSKYGSGDQIPFQITFFDERGKLLPNTRYAYVLSDHESGNIIAKNSGVASDNSGLTAFEGTDTQVLTIPSKNTYRLDILMTGQGTVGLDFDSKYAGIGSAIIEVGVGSKNSQTDATLPGWIKSNAGWWASGDIDDDTFVTAVKYLINNDVMIIPATTQGEGTENEVPGWIKSNAGWWASGDIDDDTFVVALQYLIENGILRVGQ